ERGAGRRRLPRPAVRGDAATIPGDRRLRLRAAGVVRVDGRPVRPGGGGGPVRLGGADMRIRRVGPGDRGEWRRLRAALWPDVDPAGHDREMDEYLARPELAVFVAERDGGGLAGFLEASLRPWAEGCETTPVGYI